MSNDFELIVREGPEVGTRYSLHQKYFSIGNSLENDLVVFSLSVSNQHLFLQRGENGYFAKDLDSTQGTSINGRRLSSICELQHGDLIRLGDALTLEYVAVKMIESSPIDKKQKSLIELSTIQNKSKVEKSLEIWKPSRIGCTYCFRTLDPDDSYLEMRSFVQDHANGRLYHTICWETYCKKNNLNPANGQSVDISPPPLLDISERTAVVLHAGPTNSINDQPLGISTSVIVFQGVSEPKSFWIRNNYKETITISRHLGPVWTYIDWENYSANPERSFELAAEQNQRVRVYLHPLHPSWMRYTVDLTPTQALEILSNCFSMEFNLGMAALGLLTVVHWWTFINWVGQPGMLPPLGLSSGALVGWLAFAMPTRILWWLLNLFTKLNELGATVAHRPQASIWRQFSNGSVIHLIQDRRSLLSMIVGVFVIGTVISSIIWSVLSLLSILVQNILGGLGWISLVVGYTTLLFLMIGYLLQEYGISLNQIVRTLVGYIRQQLESVNRDES